MEGYSDTFGNKTAIIQSNAYFGTLLAFCRRQATAADVMEQTLVGNIRSTIIQIHRDIIKRLANPRFLLSKQCLSIDIEMIHFPKALTFLTNMYNKVLAAL